MKSKSILFISLIGLCLSNCNKKEDVEPEVIIKIQVTDSIIFNTGGDFMFDIEASDVTAKITLVGAGGGGGGGVLRTTGGITTGGGGGGGAGQVQVFEDITLFQNRVYDVKVGFGGAGGVPGSSGGNGLASSILLDKDVLYSALAGNGGLSNSTNSKPGGEGGTGYPAGKNGGFGRSQGTFDPNVSAGNGGSGGFNSTKYGKGGNGGVGTAIEFYSKVDPEKGNNGQDGYVKIVWTGLK